MLFKYLFTSLLEAIQENLSIGCNLGRPLSKWGAWKWWAEPSFAFNQYWFGKLANIHCSVLMTGCFGVKVATTKVIFQQLLNYFLLSPDWRVLFSMSVYCLWMWVKVGDGQRSDDSLIPFTSPPSDNPDNTQWNLLPFKWGEGESKYWLICCFQLSVAFCLWGFGKVAQF